MKNAFQRLLIREFGQRLYGKMVNMILCDEKDHLIHPELTMLLCGVLHARTSDEVETMSERMEQALLRSYQISRGFWPFAGFCAAAVLALFLLVEPLPVLFLSVAAISACAIYRASEYLLNRYCYVDARIILCYRVALAEVMGAQGR